jgi:hypothetical protein
MSTKHLAQRIQRPEIRRKDIIWGYKEVNNFAIEIGI